ncbi:MAG: RES family NAD+ phosphorylase, partial [Lysobacter sp.]|nr:RES family NAD+ phosphorylase [Lysobacter sp.]
MDTSPGADGAESNDGHDHRRRSRSGRSTRRHVPGQRPPLLIRACGRHRGRQGRRPRCKRLDLYRAVPRDRADAPFGPQPRYPARRWTNDGTPAVYASASVGGALLEILAHTQGPAPDDLMLAYRLDPGALRARGVGSSAQLAAVPLSPGDPAVRRPLGGV